MKRTVEFIGILSSILGLGPLVSAVYSVVKLFREDTTDKSLYIITLSVCISLLAGVILLFLGLKKRIKGTSAYKIESYIDSYIGDEGKKFVKENKNLNLVKQTKSSIKDLIRKGVTRTLESEVYYMYLFSLLNGASNRIWAASIMGEEEWIDTPEEEEFLRLNLNASKRKVLVERIFIVERSYIKNMLDNDAIKKQIEKRDDYLKTYIVEAESLKISKPNLLTAIGSGFLAFDDFAIASDVFQDSYIRGILNLDTDAIKRNNRIFTNLRDFAQPLDKAFIEKVNNS